MFSVKQIKQLEIEILLIKNKINKLDPGRKKQIKDLKRQIRERELWITFNKQEVI